MVARKTSIITITNQKGGVGKTTCSVNLASAFATMGKKVLVIDADAQSNTTSHLGAINLAQKKNKYLFDAIESESASIDDFAIKTPFKNIDCIATDGRLRDVNRKYKGEINQFQVLHPLLHSDGISAYDIVIIDTHPAFDVLPQSALNASDYYLIPLFPEEHSLQGLAHQLRSANSIIKYQNPMLLFLGCIISQFDKNNSSHRKTEKRFREIANDGDFCVLSTMIPSSKLISWAALQETPIHFFRPESSVAKAYTALAKEIDPELKGRRKGRRHTLPSHEVVTSALEAQGEFETEVIL